MKGSTVVLRPVGCAVVCILGSLYWTHVLRQPIWDPIRLEFNYQYVITISQGNTAACGDSVVGILSHSVSYMHHETLAMSTATQLSKNSSIIQL